MERQSSCKTSWAFLTAEAVKVIVRQVLSPGEGIRRSAGAWADGGEELDRWFEQIHQSRRRIRPEPER